MPTPGFIASFFNGNNPFPPHLAEDLTLGAGIPALDRLVILSYLGTGASDDKGNAYTEDVSLGQMRVYSGKITTALITGDQIHVSGSHGFCVLQLRNTGRLNKSDTAAGSFTGDTVSNANTGYLSADFTNSAAVGAFFNDSPGNIGPFIPGEVNLLLTYNGTFFSIGSATGGARETFGSYVSSASLKQNMGVVDTSAHRLQVTINDPPFPTRGEYYLAYLVYYGTDNEPPEEPTDSGVGELSVARHRQGKRLRAKIDTGNALKVGRFNDSDPQAVGATVEVEASGVTGLCINYRRDGVAELLYCHTSGAVKRRESRDHGRNWSVADTIATGYEDVKNVVHEDRGLNITALWEQTAEKIYITVGVLNADGTSWSSWSTPVEVVAAARRGMDLTLRADGVLELDYRDTSDVLQIVRCRSLKKDGTGTWS